MKAWSNKSRVKGMALLAMHELDRTGRTGFEVMGQNPALMARSTKLKDKVTMAALLALHDIKFGSAGNYHLRRGRGRSSITIVAPDKLAPAVVRDSEIASFRKFGLRLKECSKKDPSEGRVLHFVPFDALDLLRA